jgi:hypothetical protein
MGTQREQKGRDLLTWIMANPNRPLTVEAMTKATDWNTNSASSAATRIMRQYPDNMVRTSKGTYKWVTTPADQDAPVKELFLRVIKKRTADGAMLAEDIEHPDVLFIVTPFEF